MPSGNVCPIFPVSSVSKSGMPTLIDFIYKLEKRQPISLDEAIKQPF